MPTSIVSSNLGGEKRVSARAHAITNRDAGNTVRNNHAIKLNPVPGLAVVLLPRPTISFSSLLPSHRDCVELQADKIQVGRN
jgi:hypothetical protein